jgi:endoglucanase
MGLKTAARRARPAARVGRAQLALLQRLTEAVAVSGGEGPVRRMVQEALGGLAREERVDAMGNLLVRAKGAGRGRLRVMVAAHMDEVGLMIVAADGDGLLRFDRVGGLDARQLLGKPVWIGADRAVGVIGAKPVHLTTEEERKRAVEIDNLRIDVGATSKEAALKEARPGDRAAFATPFERWGPTVKAKALDNRLGVATLIELVQRPPANVDVLAAFTVQEELGARGARVAAFSLQPDLAVVLDCTPANDLPRWDGAENVAYNTRLGAGPAIYVADRATISDRRLVEHFVRTAEKRGIPYQIRQPGGGGTDAGAIHLSGEGIPTISVSVPGRYTHTAAALARLDDWRNTLRLVHAAIARLDRSVLR